MGRRVIVLLAALFAGCAAPKPVVRGLDSCRATEVSEIAYADTPTWKVTCINQWQLRQEVFFNKEVSTGDVILYVPFKENEMGDLHGYIESINGNK